MLYLMTSLAFYKDYGANPVAFAIGRETAYEGQFKMKTPLAMILHVGRVREFHFILRGGAGQFEN